MAAYKIPLPRVVLAPVSGSVTLKVRAYTNRGASKTGSYTLSAPTTLRTIIGSFMSVGDQAAWDSVEWASVEPSGTIYFNGGADELGNVILTEPTINDEVVTAGQLVRFP